MGTALVFENVSKSFPGCGPVLDNISVTVPGGSFVSLVGPTACGKSTLLRLILGLDQPDEGRIRFEGDGVGRADMCAIAFQEPRLLPWQTVHDNIDLLLNRSIHDRSGRGNRVNEL